MTGGSRGQGASHVRAFIKEGANVAITDVRADLGQELAKELGENALFIQHDVADPEDRDRVVAQTEAAFGPVSVLVNNAGILFLKQIADTSFEEYSRVIGINQNSVFLGMKAVLPSMRRAGVGSIINVSSASIRRGVTDNAAYTAAKTAILGLSKVGALDADAVEAISSQIPVKRFAEPEEVSSMIVHLASDESCYTTGAEIAVDGGLTA